MASSRSDKIGPTYSKCAIIGAGSVGAACALSMIYRKVFAEILMVDIDENMCRAQVQDLTDATYTSNVRIRQGTLKEAGQADIIVITAGAKQKPDETRLNLIEKNYFVLNSVIGGMRPIRSDAIILCVSNPVDVLTYFGQQMVGEDLHNPKAQVIGSGTLLDSIRLRDLLAKRLNVSNNAINAFVIGEHGDSQAIAWSSVTVSGAHISAIDNISSEERKEISKTVTGKAGDIIAAKGFTSYGIGAVTATICEAIIFDERQVFPLSTWREQYGCCISLPVVVGRGGIVSNGDETGIKLPLNEAEQANVKASVATLKEHIKKFYPDIEKS